MLSGKRIVELAKPQLTCVEGTTLQEEVCSPGKPAVTSCPAQCKCTEGEEKIIHFKYFFLD